MLASSESGGARSFPTKKVGTVGVKIHSAAWAWAIFSVAFGVADAWAQQSERASRNETAPEPGDSAPEVGAEETAVGSDGASASSAPGPTVEDTDYAVRLRGLEERVNELKEKIFRSKARLLLLRETVLNGVVSGARARIVHRNDMGASFVLREATYALDGSTLFNKTAEDGSLDERREIELFDGSIVPGNHNISVFLMYQGNGYGVFSYLRGYKFRIQSSYAFTAEEGKLTTVKVVAYEKGGFTTDLQDRPAVRYDVEVKQDVQAASTEAEAAAAAEAGGS